MQLYWVSASHTGRYARFTSVGLYVMYAQAVRSVCPVESTGLATKIASAIGSFSRCSSTTCLAASASSCKLSSTISFAYTAYVINPTARLRNGTGSGIVEVNHAINSRVEELDEKVEELDKRVEGLDEGSRR